MLLGEFGFGFGLFVCCCCCCCFGGFCCYFIYLLIVYVCFVLEWVFLVILEVFVGSFSFCFNISLI